MNKLEQIISFTLTALEPLAGKNLSRHFDEIGVPREAYSVEFWRSGALGELVKRLRARGELRTILLVFSLENSANIMTSINFESGLDIDLASPPTLYLLERLEFFDIADEEYRRRLLLSDHIDIIYMFRSWRDDVAAKRGWEFNNAIYVWSPKCLEVSVIIT